MVSCWAVLGEKPHTSDGFAEPTLLLFQKFGHTCRFFPHVDYIPMLLGCCIKLISRDVTSRFGFVQRWATCPNFWPWIEHILRIGGSYVLNHTSWGFPTFKTIEQTHRASKMHSSPSSCSLQRSIHFLKGTTCAWVNCPNIHVITNQTPHVHLSKPFIMSLSELTYGVIWHHFTLFFSVTPWQSNMACWQIPTFADDLPNEPKLRRRCPSHVWLAEKRMFLNSTMVVSWNWGTSKSSILMVFSIINHPFWGTPIYGNPHMGPIAISPSHQSWLSGQSKDSRGASAWNQKTHCWWTAQ